LLGELSNQAHGIAGRVHYVDERTLRVSGFRYDGTGPDAFFYVGRDGKPNGVDGVLIQYPYGTPTPLREAEGDFVTLTLPEGIVASEVKWVRRTETLSEKRAN